jgi:hypothetical protein
MWHPCGATWDWRVAGLPPQPAPWPQFWERECITHVVEGTAIWEASPRRKYGESKGAKDGGRRGAGAARTLFCPMHRPTSGSHTSDRESGR